MAKEKKPLTTPERFKEFLGKNMTQSKGYDWSVVRKRASGNNNK